MTVSSAPATAATAARYAPRLPPTAPALAALDWLAPGIRPGVIPWFTSVPDLTAVAAGTALRLLDGFPECLVHPGSERDGADLLRVRLPLVGTIEHVAVIDLRAERWPSAEVVVVDVGPLSGAPIVDRVTIGLLLQRLPEGARAGSVIIAVDDAPWRQAPTVREHAPARLAGAVGAADLAISDPPPVALDLRAGVLRYSAGGRQALFATDGVRWGSRALAALAEEIVSSEVYAGPEFSAGDDWLAEVACGRADPLDDTCWGAALACHHITDMASMAGVPVGA